MTEQPGDPTFIPWWGRVLLGAWILGIFWYAWPIAVLGLVLLLWPTVAAFCLWGIEAMSDWLDKK